MLREKRARPGPQASFSLVPRRLLPPRTLLLAPVLFPRPLGTSSACQCPQILLSSSTPSPVRSQSLGPLPELLMLLRSLQSVAPATSPRALLHLCLACATSTPPPCPARLPHPGSPETRDCNRCRPSALPLAGRGGIPGDTRSPGSQIRGLLRAWLRQGCVSDPQTFGWARRGRACMGLSHLCVLVPAVIYWVLFASLPSTCECVWLRVGTRE